MKFGIILYFILRLPFLLANEANDPFCQEDEKNIEPNRVVLEVIKTNKYPELENIISGVIKSNTDQESDFFFRKFIRFISKTSKYLNRNIPNDSMDYFLRTWYQMNYSIEFYDLDKKIMHDLSDQNKIVYAKVSPCNDNNTIPRVINFTPFWIKCTDEVRYWIFLNDLYENIP